MTGLADVRDIVRGAVASFMGFGGRLIARAILMVIAGRAYGIEPLGVLGLFAAVSEITAAIGVIGLKRGLLDILSEDAENNSPAEPRIIEATIIAISFSVFLALAAAAGWHFFAPAQNGLAVLLLIAIPSIVFTDIALTASKFRRVIQWDVWARGIADPWGFLALAILFLQFGHIETGLIYAYFGSLMIAATISGAGAAHTYGLSNFLKNPPRFDDWTRIPKRSVSVGVADLGFMSLRRVDLIVLGAIVGPQGAGLYYMVQQLASIPQKVYALFEPMMSPVIARLHHKMDGEKIRHNLLGVCRWVMIIQLAISIPMFVFGDYLLALFGAQFAVGASVLAIVLLAELIDGSFMAVETPLLFAKPTIPPSLMAVTIIIEIVMIAVLSRYFGVEGAAIGFLIAIAFLALGRLIMLKKHLNISVINVSYLMPIAFGAIVAGALFGFRQIAGAQIAPYIIVAFILGVAAFLALIRTFALTSADKILIRALFQRRRKARAAP